MKELQISRVLRYIGLILVVVISSYGCTPAAAPTSASFTRGIFYVSTTGSDSNDCLSPARPCLTIDEAMAKGHGDDYLDIHVSPGTYVFPDDSRSGEGGTIERNVHLIADEEGVTFRNEVYPIKQIAIRSDIEVTLTGITIPSQVYVEAGASLTLQNVTIRDQVGDYLLGIGIINHGTLTLENSTVSNNYVGIYNQADGTANILSSRIVDNKRASWSGDGPIDSFSGGILNEGTITITDSTIARNIAKTGGGIQNRGGEITIERSTLSNNRSARNDGNAALAIYNDTEGTIHLLNTTISGNRIAAGGYGAAIWNFGSLSISFSTIAENGGMGVYTGIVPGTSSDVQIYNSIIANNAEQDCYWLGQAAATWMATNVRSDGSCSTPGAFAPEGELGGIHRPPEGDMFLGNLAENGGPTRTHALLEGSPAIDAAEGACPATDQRGVGRPVGGGCDIGAYEFSFAVAADTQGTPDTVTILTNTPTRSPTSTSTPDLIPVFTFTTNTNCRFGPGTAYDVDDVFLAGESTRIEGRSQGEPLWWWVLKSSGGYCWVADSMGTASGPTWTVRVILPASLPTATQSPPTAPYKLIVQNHVCGGSTYTVTLAWEDKADNELGYRVYRDGVLIATLGANVTSYTDSPPSGGPYYYVVEAYNDAGAANSNSVKDEGCIF